MITVQNETTVVLEAAKKAIDAARPLTQREQLEPYERQQFITRVEQFDRVLEEVNA